MPYAGVATVLTVYGIETFFFSIDILNSSLVATVLTVYGIETSDNCFFICNWFCCCNSTYRLRYWNLTFPVNKCFNPSRVATVLTVYGIETFSTNFLVLSRISFVATVLTVYGIETRQEARLCQLLIYRSLQQYLPFTVLKHVR